mmetsp:Transcript_7162/g.17861  ORF Transcript_7162/g.17861 Transcript_7162/m.17861 type:complete len:543 (-) Transcript_7162:81-1709(-)
MSDGFVTVAQCVEGLPQGRFVWELLFCGFLAWFMLGAINESTPLAFSYVTAEWPMSERHLSLMSAALALGNFLAVLLGGWAADLYGRTAVIRPALLLTASCGMVLQTARTFFQALLARFLLGLVSGALLGVLPPLIAELLPARNRGFYLTVWMSGWPAGALLSVLVGCLSPGLNWRAFHTALLVPAIVVYVCLRAEMLPESPRFLYLVGRRDEGYNTLLDIYEKEQLPLPWPAEAIAVTSAPPRGQGSESSLSSSSSCHPACKRALSSNVGVALRLALAMLLTSAAAQSLKIWMPVVLLRHAPEPADSAATAAGLLGDSLHSMHGGVLRDRLQMVPGANAAGAAGAVASLLSLVPNQAAQSNHFVILVLAQAYIVQLLGTIFCAYASTWVRRKQMVQWSLPLAAIMTLLAVAVAESGYVFLCGPLVGLQLTAQFCSLNFLLIFAAEHFPTSRRAAVVGLACLAAQLGDFITPILGGLVIQRVSKAGATLFFSALYVVAWLVASRLPLPSSRERPLHDVEEPKGSKEGAARQRKREYMTYQTI